MASDDGASPVPYIFLGLGVVGAGVGGYFGLRAFSLRSDSDAECEGGCSPAGVSSNEDAKTAADISTVGMGVGLLGLTVGAWMLLSGPSTEAPEQQAKRTLRVVPNVGPRSSSLSLQGRF